MPAVFPEKRVLEIWQGSLQSRTDLVTEENEPIEIVYPGRLNDDRGADLRDAVIATSQGLLKGDIEIHVKSSSWWTHRHHQDPAYNRVILHVVYWNDAEKTIVLENGFKVPTLVLHNYVGAPAARGIPAAIPPMPCRNAVHRCYTSLISQLLEEAGEQRFLSVAAHFRKVIAKCGAGQALYRGIMTALGYSKNKEAMAELANRMPMARLAATALGGAPENECLAQYQARLIGMAGLLPSQRGVAFRTDYPADAWADKLENIWSTGGETAVMSADDWRFFKVRPGNYPVRRLAAMSYLLLRYRREGLPAGLQGILQTAAINDAGRSLELSLLVNPDSFWGRYLDFGQPGGGVIPALLGRERAAEIVVNVLLPFAAAAGFTDGPPELSRKALGIYREYRAPAENTLEKHMRKQLGIGRHLSNSARRQQGLIHIYKTRCSQGKCDECPLGELPDGPGFTIV
jgi:hypothetical protein